MSIKVDDAELNAALKKMAERIGDPRPVLREIGELFRTRKDRGRSCFRPSPCETVVSATGGYPGAAVHDDPGFRMFNFPVFSGCCAVANLLEFQKIGGGTRSSHGKPSITRKRIDMLDEIRAMVKWIHLVTPVPSSIAQPLAEGLNIPVVCKENSIRDWVPLPLISCEVAIRKALERIEQEQVDTCCFDGEGRALPEWAMCGDADYAGGTVMRRGYRFAFMGDALEVWEAIETIGGRNGWYFAQTLWRLRGMLDRMAGGPGLIRGRRHSKHLRTGDALDLTIH